MTDNPIYDQALISAAGESIEQLTKQLNETSIPAVIRNNKCVIVHMVQSPRVLQNIYPYTSLCE